MGWIRANWLDALIFLLVAAIMAGVVFFLLGVNPFSGPQGTPPSPTTAPPQAAPAPSTPEPKPSIPAPSPAKPQTAPETVVTLLPVPSAPPSASKPVPAPPKVEDRPPRPAPKRPILTADPGGSWRVVVGSFANRENADRLAATLRQQGYPVGLEAAGNLTRVWVGPYNTQDRARTVAGSLDRYQPQVGRVPAGTPAPQPGRYLQVGAFRNAQSAQAVVEAVQQAGYPVVLVEEGGLVKVRVGPLEDAPAVGAELRARGLEVLEVR